MLKVFPEAFLNGIIVTMLVALRLEWVWSFQDEEYLARWRKVAGELVG